MWRGRQTNIGESTSNGDHAHPYRRWVISALAILVLGTSASIFGAMAIARTNDQRTHNAFKSSSAEIADTLELYVHHQLDLITSVESLLIGNPQATRAAFNQWASAVNLLAHNKDLTELGVINYVPASQLAAYEAHESSMQSAPFHVTPAGSYPYYCFAVMGVTRPGTASPSRDDDLCAGDDGSIISTARTSGKGSVVPYMYHGVKTIAFETPLYRGGSSPTTVAARERSFVAVIALTLEPKVVLQSALDNYPHMQIKLIYGAHSNAVFASGVAPTDAEHVFLSLKDGWTVEILGLSHGGGLFSDDNALDVLFGGIALSAVVAALLFVLGTDRSRLRRLVHDRTTQLKFQATHDALTGLPNRTLVVDRMEQLLSRNRRHGTQGAAFFVDLDDFKNVNDSLGHDAGDRLLVLVAARMRAALRDVDTIGRVGGDEFVILIDGVNQAQSTTVVAERLLDAMRAPFELDGSLLPLIVNTSIGIAVGDRPSGGILLRDADVALYQAKAKGKNKYVFFDPVMEVALGRKIALEFDLRSALADHQFHLRYQPIYALDDLTIVGVEALLRWQHPTLGLLDPDEFIPVLERTGQIRDVGAWVLTTACNQVARWRARGDDLTLAVNVSGRQFDDHLLVDQIQAALVESGLEGRSLTIEVTETALMLDMASVVRDLDQIRELGVSIAIDDFGTGYSSLASLRELPVDCIKIDQSFVASITTSEESMALVRTFIQLSADLGLRTVAEGVETFEQMDLLRASHIDFVQGYLFSHPLDPDEVEENLLAPRRLASGNEKNVPPPPVID